MDMKQLETMGLVELIALSEQLRDRVADLEGRISVRTAELRAEVSELLDYKEKLEAAIDAAEEETNE